MTPFDSLREEINKAIAALDPEVRGLDDLTKVSLSSATLAVVADAKESHRRRRELLNVVIQDLDQLENALTNLTNDGYPALPKSNVDELVFAELQGQLADLQSAIAQFQPAEAKAATLTLALGPPTKKP